MVLNIFDQFLGRERQIYCSQDNSWLIYRELGVVKVISNIFANL